MLSKSVEWYEEQIPEFDDEGNFKAVITGTSEKSKASNWRGVSACVAEVEQVGAGGTRRRLVFSSEAADSHEVRAYVAAVASVVEAMMPGSKVTIYCRNQYIVNALNNWLQDWASNGWRRSKGQPVAIQDIWSRVYSVITERHLDVQAVWIKPTDTELQVYVEQLLDEARDRRQAQSASLANV